MKLKDILSKPLTSEEFHSVVKERVKQYNLKCGKSIAKKAEYISKMFPELKSRVINSADNALQGMLVLPGTGGKLHFAGNPPEWHADPFHDQEYVHGLNRTYQWKILLNAFALTKDERYAQKVAAEIHDWINKCPRPEINDEIKNDVKKLKTSFASTTPWNCIDAGERMNESWPPVIEYLMETDIITPEILEDYAISIYEHGEVFEQISPIFFPNADHNHYISENLGLLKLSCLFPEFKKSEEWKLQAMHELERCAMAQMTAEGGQIEGCPGYHDWVIYCFCMAAMIARENGLDFSSNYMERIRKGVEYTIHTFRPSGTTVPWGDSSAEKAEATLATVYWFLLSGETEYISYLKKLVSREDIKNACMECVYNVPSEQIWNIPDIEELFASLDSINSSEDNKVLPLVFWNHEMKQAAMRTGWDCEALSVFFACRTPINNAHAHIDPMGFDFTALGKPLIVDPGAFTYADNENRKNFKSAAWHNTLTINNKDPFEYLGSWAYGQQKSGDILNVYETDRILAVEAGHLNFEPAVHKRVVAIVDNSFLLVLDRVYSINPESTVQIYFHFNSTSVNWDNKNHYAYSEDKDVNVSVYTTDNLQGSILEGKISDIFDLYRPSQRLFLQDVLCKTTVRNYASVIIPYRTGTVGPEVKLLQVDESDEKLMCSFVLNGKEFMFTWGKNGIGIL